MPWHAVYERDGGRLVSVASVAAEELSEGLELLSLPLGRPADDQEWDPERREFVSRRDDA